MKKNTKIKKGGMSKGKMLAIGTGIAALGVGAYYFLGPKGKEHRKKASALMAKIKKEVKSKIKKAKNATESTYHKIVDTLADTYAKQYKAHEAEIKALAKKLKSKWKSAVAKKTKASTRKNKK